VHKNENNATCFFETTELEFSNKYLHQQSSNERTFDLEKFIKNFIKTRLDQSSPMFSYFVYNVDKNIRKYTRGKSGKYVFI